MGGTGRSGGQGTGRRQPAWQRSRWTVLVGVTALGVAGTPGAAHADDGGRTGFRTTQASMLTTGDRADVTFTPIMTTGETLRNGYRFEAIPDGIAVRPRGHGVADVYVNHETSTVPFPFVPAAPTAANGQNDFDNSQLSRLTVHARSASVLNGSYAITGAEGYHRFCSNYLATSREGFDRPILFTNEEAVEWVNRDGGTFPAAAQGAPDARQVGVAVALDVRSGERTPIWGMGRLNHENTVALPGYRSLVTLTGDDTFLSLPPQSQVYSYLAKDTDALLADKGDMYAFVSDTPGVDDYFDVAPGSTQSISGHFVKVPKDIATGKKADGTDLMAADKGFSAPAPGEFAADAFGRPTDGPQWVLEKWGDANGVFQFIRIEDIAYDKRPGRGNVVYLADSGAGTAGAPGARVSTNGRVWKMVLDRKDPTKVTSLSVLVDGDVAPVKAPRQMHQVDNLETTRNSILVTEDPGSSQQFPFGSTDPNATTARLWRVPLDDPAGKEVVAKVDQGADGGPTDVDGRAPGNLGAWESSGVVDASAVFGRGAFLVTVQAHTLWVEKAPGRDLNGDGGPDWTDKREGGQLVLVRIPGA